MATPTHDDIDIPLDMPSHRLSKGDTSLSSLFLTYAVVLALAALFAGFLGAVSGDLL